MSGVFSYSYSYIKKSPGMTVFISLTSMMNVQFDDQPLLILNASKSRLSSRVKAHLP